MMFPTIKRVNDLRAKNLLKKISVWDTLIYLTVFFMIIPDGLTHINFKLDHILYNYGLYLSFGLSVIMFVVAKFHRAQTSPIFIWLMAFFIATILIFLAIGYSQTAWKYAFSVGLFTVVLAEANRTRLKTVMNAFLFMLEFWIAVNFLLMLLRPWGLYYDEANRAKLNWILGYKSSLQYYVLPAICLSWMKAAYKKRYLGLYLLLGISVFECLFVRNTMLLIGLFLIILLLLCARKSTWLFNIWTYYLGILAANVLVLFCMKPLAATSLVSSLLMASGKDANLSYRASLIWPKTWELIGKHPLFGNGLLVAGDRTELYGYAGAIHAHNQLLEIAFVGGLALLVLYIAFHLYIGVSLWNNRRTDAAMIISIYICVLYVMMTVEVYNRLLCGPVWLILYLGGNCRQTHRVLLEDAKRKSLRLRGLKHGN